MAQVLGSSGHWSPLHFWPATRLWKLPSLWKNRTRFSHRDLERLRRPTVPTARTTDLTFSPNWRIRNPETQDLRYSRQVTEVVVCDPRRNKLLQDGTKGDRVDARKLAELLRGGMLRSVYHGHEKTRRLKQLVRAYETFCVDTNRAMVRIKALYRGRGIRTPGSSVYQGTQRTGWLEQLTETGTRQRAAWLYAQLDQVGSFGGRRKRP